MYNTRKWLQAQSPDLVGADMLEGREWQQDREYEVRSQVTQTRLLMGLFLQRAQLTRIPKASRGEYSRARGSHGAFFPPGSNLSVL